MNTKQRLVSLLAASSLAAFAAACGGRVEATEVEAPATKPTGGGEAEAACGGGACGAVSDAPIETPNSEATEEAAP